MYREGRAPSRYKIDSITLIDMKNLTYCLFLSTLAAVSQASCSSEDEPAGIIKETEEENRDFREITFSIGTDTVSNTRCFVNRAEFTGTDGCPEWEKFEFLSMMMFIDGVQVDNPEIIYNGKISSPSQPIRETLWESPYITDAQINPGYLSLTLKLDTSVDPSAIRLMFSGYLRRANDYTTVTSYSYTGLQNSAVGFDNSASGQDVLIHYDQPEWRCIYFADHYLNDKNDWGTINRKIVLRRQTSDIVLLNEDPQWGFYGNDYNVYFCPILNYEDSLLPYMDEKGYIPEYNYSVNLNDNTFFYCPKIDTVYTMFFGYIRNYAIRNFANRKVTYNGKEYYLSTPYAVMASTRKSYPVDNTTKRELRYITLLRRDAWNANPYYWTSLPLPEGGLQANKRYVYLLGKEFKLWQNSIKPGTLSTKADTPCPGNRDAFQIIETDYDDPLPFDIEDPETLNLINHF